MQGYECGDKLIHYLSAVECVKYVANDRDNDQSDYYTSDEFLAVFDRIWRELGKMDKKLFPDFGTIKDSAIFKSSPFHKLYPDQLEAKANIEMIIKNALEDTTAQLSPRTSRSRTHRCPGRHGSSAHVPISCLCRTDGKPPFAYPSL